MKSFDKYVVEGKILINTKFNGDVTETENIDHTYTGSKTDQGCPRQSEHETGSQ